MIKKHINLSGFSCYNNLFLTSNKGKTRSKFQQNLQSIYNIINIYNYHAKIFLYFLLKTIGSCILHQTRLLKYLWIFSTYRTLISPNFSSFFHHSIPRMSFATFPMKTLMASPGNCIWG